MPDGLGAFAIVVLGIVVCVLVAFVWLLARDTRVTRTSFGFYVERQRFEEEEFEEQITEPHARWPAQEP